MSEPSEQYVIEGELHLRAGMTVAELCQAICADFMRHGVRLAEFHIPGQVNGLPVRLKFDVRLEPTSH